MLERYEDRNGTERVRLTRCPCGHEFNSSRGTALRAHISSHNPEDFGLSPLGKRGDA